MRFLFRWHHVDVESKLRGPAALLKVVERLEGFEAPAAAWEQELFPARMKQYVGEWLEHATYGGEVAWRDSPNASRSRRSVRAAEIRQRPSLSGACDSGRNASLTFVRRRTSRCAASAARPETNLADGPPPLPSGLSPAAKDVAAVLERRGAVVLQRAVRVGAAIAD